MHTTHKILLLVLLVLVFCVAHNGVAAFGAGNIPSFAYMEGRAFRHGDIEDVLEELLKKSSGGGLSLGALIGKGGSKFGGLDVKRVYFGNWLRDYSQAVDVAGLKKLPLQTILNLCMALGFLAHGYATAEFEVTEERLGVYLPVEHIDNPKGYGGNEDPRKYHPKLRGPVDPRELEVDPRTGMKNYIANEGQHWDTSKALVRRLLARCVSVGRAHRASGRKEDEYEAYRLLGTLLHTLEDFPAHSNFTELALVGMGHQDVFVHIGDGVRVRAHSGRMVAPLVTGTFGGSDFMHSLLGEATDHISSASVSDLNKALDGAAARSRSGPGGQGSGANAADTLRELLFKLPGGAGGETARELDSVERIRAGPAAGGKAPEQMSPQEMYAVLWQVLKFRDSVVKSISGTIEKIPGLGPLIEKLQDSISVFVFTTLEPYLKPLLKTATSGLQSASSEVINSQDQYEVFDNPHASDPTHSFLSKDHFNLILNEPAGKLARVIVHHTVSLVVGAWDNASVDVNRMSEDVLQCLFHPDFHDQSSKVQREMLQCMRDWVQSLGANQHRILSRLTKHAVRSHENIRLGGEGGHAAAEGTAAYNYGVNAQHDIQGRIHGAISGIPGAAQAQALMGHFGSPAGAPPGFRRELPPGASAGGESSAYFQGAPAGGAQTPSFPGAPSPAFPGAQTPAYPGAPPHREQSMSYGPPAGAPPSFPGGTPGGYADPPARQGYNPSYSSYGSPPPPPSFPGSMGMPGAPPPFPGSGMDMPGAPPLGGYAPPPGPGAYGFPSPAGPPPGGFPSPGFGMPQGGAASPYGAPPAFPDAQMPGPGGQPHPQHHGHHGQHGAHHGHPHGPQY